MAEKRNRADLISGGTEWICLALSRRGMDANCRETDERSRAVKRNREAMPRAETEMMGLDLQRDGNEKNSSEMELSCSERRRSGAETPGNAERRQFKII